MPAPGRRPAEFKDRAIRLAPGRPGPTRVGPVLVEMRMSLSTGAVGGARRRAKRTSLRPEGRVGPGVGASAAAAVRAGARAGGPWC